MKKKVVFVGNDIGACKSLDSVATELHGNGVEVSCHFAMGKPMDLPNRDLLGGADLLVSGMSSSPVLAEREIKSVDWANHNSVPVALFADVPHCAARPWFRFKNVTALFVPRDEDIEEAQSCFPSARVVKTGNPAHDFYFLPSTRSGEQIRVELGIGPSTCVLLVTGGKSPSVSMLTLGGVVAAARLFARRCEKKGENPNILIAFSLHPGDRTPSEFYEGLVAFAGVQLRIYTDKVVSSSTLLTVANLLVSSYTTNEVDAACRRVPIVEFAIPEARARIRSIQGTDDWPAYSTDKIVLSTDGNVVRLANHIEHLYDAFRGEEWAPHKSLTDLRKRQEKAWPAPEGEMGNTKMMAAAIMELLA